MKPGEFMHNHVGKDSECWHFPKHAQFKVIVKKERWKTISGHAQLRNIRHMCRGQDGGQDCVWTCLVGIIKMADRKML